MKYNSLSAIQKRADKVNCNSPNSRRFASMFDDFINWKERMKTEGPFLLAQLEGKRSVFDASLGTGGTSIWLVSSGFDVTSNEIDAHYVRMAQKNAKEAGVRLRITSCDWRTMHEHMEPGSFEAVILTGNSFTYIFEKHAQLSVLRNFSHFLQPGGRLILDTRNYQYMLDNRLDIIQNGNFRYSGDFVYCGIDQVPAMPIVISDQLVTFEYFHIASGKRAILMLYPFRREEIEALLEESGFRNIQVFSDYKPRFNAEADFFQFVCTK